MIQHFRTGNQCHRIDDRGWVWAEEPAITGSYEPNAIVPTLAPQVIQKPETHYDKGLYARLLKQFRITYNIPRHVNQKRARIVRRKMGLA